MKNYSKLFVSIISSSLVLGLGASFTHKKEAAVEIQAGTIDINDYSACDAAHTADQAGNLLTALRTITSEGHSASYSALWSTYCSVFVRPDGKIFDYYSDSTNYVPGGSAQGHNYSKEGDSYNREHSIPKSWWNQGKSDPATGTQGTDPFFVVPTDGYVNNIRSAFPFGMVQSATYTSNNGFCKKGSAIQSWGYSGTVFEPDDSLKGDFARMYYYVIAKYPESYGWTYSEGSSTFSGSTSTNHGLTDYAVKLFSAWSALDPVSDWERQVNDGLAAIQGNRNPFIDHPEYANTLWGSNSNYTPYPEETKTLSSISLSDNQTSYEVGDTFVKPTVTAHYDDNSTRDVTSSATFSGYNLNSVGKYTVTASYTEGGVTKTATYNISVTASTKILSSIAVNNPKTDFKVGNSFTFGGTVTATFSNSSQLDVTDQAEFSGYNLSQEGNQTVTVSYTYGGTTKTATYTINVSAAGGGEAGSTDETFSYDDMSKWSVSNKGSASGYILCPDSNSDYSVALMEDIFSDKTITSDVVITINSATFGSGSVPTASTYSVYNSEACTSQIVTKQSGTLPSSSTYTDVVYTVSQEDAQSFVDDLAIKITKPGRQIRLKTIRVEFDYETSGSPTPITGITASVKNDKTFYVGETITSSDITVRDSNNQILKNFDFDDYQFKYSDSTSGGAVSKKYLVVDYEDFSCNVGVNVQRKAYVTPAGGSTLEHTGAEFKTAGIASGTSSSYKENQTATVDGVTFNVSGYVYNNTYLSFSTSSSKAPGSVANTSPYPSGIANVIINGASPDIQLSTDGDTWVDFASANTNTINYYYLKVYFKNTSQSGYINISSISVTIKASETAENVSNYIMYEDTNNQCVSKLSIAMNYFSNLTSSGKSTFASSDDYVIKSARERLEAWAANQGKTINYSTGELINKSGAIQFGVGQENSSTTIIIIVSAMSIASLSVLLVIKKKRLHN